MKKHEFGKHNIDCPCSECQKIRDLLFNLNESGQATVIGHPKDLKKLGIKPIEEKP